MVNFQMFQIARGVMRVATYHAARAGSWRYAASSLSSGNIARRFPLVRLLIRRGTAGSIIHARPVGGPQLL